MVLTTSEREEDLRSSYEYMANSYVTKPIEIEEFEVTVGRLGLYWVLTNTPPKIEE